MLYQETRFKKALPIWQAGTEAEMNRALSFESVFEGASATLRVSGHTHFQVFVNGQCLFRGPARAAKGYFCVTELTLPGEEGAVNAVRVDVVSEHCIEFEYMKQTPFLCAETEQAGRVVSATGVFGWRAFSVPERVQRVQRYSVQRGFCEVYRMERAKERQEVVCAVLAPGRFIRTQAPSPVFLPLDCTRFLARGTVEYRPVTQHYNDRAVTEIGKDWGVYFVNELEICSVFDAEDLHLTKTEDVPALPISLENQFATVAFDKNRTGCLTVDVTCHKDTRLYLTFDEFLTDGQVDFKRLLCSNVILYFLEAGKTYHLLSAQPYTLQCLNLISFGGAVTVHRVGMLHERMDENRIGMAFAPDDDEELRLIYNAAKESFCQNALDLLNSDSTRERAVYLCDLFFMGRVERLMTGKAVTERASLANFAMAKHPDRLPEGMIPMCYPSDSQPNGLFIPTWAMWYFLEIFEYCRFTGDWAFLEDVREQMQKLLAFLRRYELENGLLCDLPSWVFVEWSHCNQCTDGINYPCNMLYYRFQKELAEAYGDAELAARAERLRTLICQNGRDGLFFYDHSVPDGAGHWVLKKDDLTETCQYYAFYMGVTSKEEDAELWQTMVRDFGPDRQKTGLWKEVYPSNALMGMYMRFDLLSDAGETKRLEHEICAYFGKMACLTGTLWEHDNPSASCNHGFASHVLVWLHRLGLLQKKPERG